MKRGTGSMHIDDTSRHYVTASGEQRVTRCFLLRRSYRDQDGKPRNETVANISDLPDEVIASLKLALKSVRLVDADSAFEVERSVPHGNTAAVHVMAQKVGLRSMLGPPCQERDIAYGLIVSQAVRPKSKLSTVRWWNSGDTTLASDLGVADVTTDEAYAAMDWLLAQKPKIEKKLARRHLKPAGWRCMTCPPPGWRAPAASWPRSGTPRREARPDAGRIRIADRSAGPPGRH